MSVSLPDNYLQVVSTATDNGNIIELSQQRVVTKEPEGKQVLIQIEAAPINPSDLGPLLGSADVSSSTQSGAHEHAVARRFRRRRDRRQKT